MNTYLTTISIFFHKILKDYLNEKGKLRNFLIDQYTKSILNDDKFFLDKFETTRNI